VTPKINNIDIYNWVDYIDKKFEDKSVYKIEKQNDRDFLIKSKTNKTTIWFYINDDHTLLDCQYYSTDCHGWSGETLNGDNGSGIFNQRNIDGIISVLQTPIKNGWISVDYYFSGSLLLSKTFYDNDRNSTPFIYQRSGCLSIILFPLFWLLIKLIDLGVLGHKKEVTVPPIITTTR
jgi:hypothetical protein